jgi:hypothetical protein
LGGFARKYQLPPSMSQRDPGLEAFSKFIVVLEPWLGEVVGADCAGARTVYGKA